MFDRISHLGMFQNTLNKIGAKWSLHRSFYNGRGFGYENVEYPLGDRVLDGVIEYRSIVIDGSSDMEIVFDLEGNYKGVSVLC